MRRPRVVVTDFIGGALQEEIEILGDLADVEALAARSGPDRPRRGRGCDHGLSLHQHHGADDRTLQHCRLIVRCGVGYDRGRRRGRCSRHPGSPTSPTTAPRVPAIGMSSR